MPIIGVLYEDRTNHVFGQAQRPAKMLRAGLYTRVSANDQQALAIQNRAMRKYATRRGRMIALQVREVNAPAPCVRPGGRPHRLVFC
jgi:hypothetical protein